MTRFLDVMKEQAEKLPPEAKDLVKVILRLQHEKRFADRSQVPQELAGHALSLAAKAISEDRS